MKKIRIQKLNRGELFKLTNTQTAPLYVKGLFDIGEGGYECCLLENQTRKKILKANEKVFI